MKLILVREDLSQVEARCGECHHWSRSERDEDCSMGLCAASRQLMAYSMRPYAVTVIATHETHVCASFIQRAVALT